ncbi:hypothetical protein B296_00020974 [Ensete ventricosum]|uniref:Uncharacterized protein n=1 Tax=Ensete ventricosum TaxID=4639 RepID=A0A426YC32_ENSVE|nr:hypothetical protein B296_00020974 [Ensete ventricosum]
MSQERPQSNNLKVHLREISTTQHPRAMPWATYEPELCTSATYEPKLCTSMAHKPELHLGQVISPSRAPWPLTSPSCAPRPLISPSYALGKLRARVVHLGHLRAQFPSPMLDHISSLHLIGHLEKVLNDMTNVDLAVTSPLSWTTRSPAWPTRHSEADLT